MTFYQEIKLEVSCRWKALVWVVKDMPGTSSAGAALIMFLTHTSTCEILHVAPFSL